MQTDGQPGDPSGRHAVLLLFFSVVLVAIGVYLLLPQMNGHGNPAMAGCRHHLQQIAVALIQYHNEYGTLPPAIVADKFGRPMHSWRVLVLPYLGQEPLYKSYRFDEPWNGPHNAKLLNTAVDVFRCPKDRSAGKTDTSYVAITGPNTVWPDDGPISPTDLADSASDTILIVEMADSGIHWMEPRDLQLDRLAPLINAEGRPSISSRHPGGANVLFCDGAFRFLTEDTKPADLNAMITTEGSSDRDRL